jgi:hypothetical protein
MLLPTFVKVKRAQIVYIHTLSVDRLYTLWNKASQEGWAVEETNKMVAQAIERARGMIMFHRSVLTTKPFRDRYNKLLHILDEHARVLVENCRAQQSS